MMDAEDERGGSPASTGKSLVGMREAEFRSLVLDHFRREGRDLPWRRTSDPYSVLVSEIMLQQTQVPRVLEPYVRFLASFPEAGSLAAAPLAAVLAEWQGLGYNRRAVNLKRAAEAIVERHGGRVPRDLAALRALPGVGPATAAAVMAFAFGEAHPYIETNIRAAFLHHFFRDREGVRDAEIMPLVEATLDREDPRTWYYALMDYGAALKRELPNPSRRSAHHTRQSPFEGSRRQLRARLLRALLAEGTLDAAEAAERLGPPVDADAAAGLLRELEREGFVTRRGTRYTVT